MIRFPILFAALAASTMAITATVRASDSTDLGFRIEQRNDGTVQANFRRPGRDDSRWTDQFEVSALAGLDVTKFGAPANGPIQFSVMREAGRLDCAGTGGHGVASGRCRFSEDGAFFADLDRAGVAVHDADDRFTMMAVGVQRDLVSAIRDARYPAPSASDLIAMTALGVDRGYIGSLAGTGYRPRSIDTLVQFKALGVTPDYIANFRRLGFGDLPAEQLIEFRALNITADYVAGFRQVGMGGLSPSALVQFKALGITPAYVAAMRRNGVDVSPDRLVELKALGFEADALRGLGAASRR
jgi:hypothetical protein